MYKLIFLLLLPSIILADHYVYLGFGINSSTIYHEENFIKEDSFLNPYQFQVTYQDNSEIFTYGTGIYLNSFGYQETIGASKVIEKFYFLMLPLEVGTNPEYFKGFSLKYFLAYNGPVFKYFFVEESGVEKTRENFFDNYWDEYYSQGAKIRYDLDLYPTPIYSEIFIISNIGSLSDVFVVDVLQMGINFGFGLNLSKN